MGHAHDRLHDLHPLVEELQIFRLVGGAPDIGIGRVGLLLAHAVVQAGLFQQLRHFLAAAKLVDELLIEPRFVDAQIRIDQQAVTVEALDVVALVGAAIAPDVDVVFLHGAHQHGAGHGASDRGGVEVGNAGGRDVEGSALQRGQSLAHQLHPAVEQASLLRAVFQRPARDIVVVGLVGLPQVRGVAVRDCALLAHPVDGRAGVQASREGDPDLFSDGERLQNSAHKLSSSMECPDRAGIVPSGRNPYETR